MRRAVGILPIITIALAACAAPNAGGGAGSGDDAHSSMPAMSGSPETSDAAVGSSGSPEASASSSADAETGTLDERVSIDDVLADPAAFEDQEITLSENVDEVFVDDAAFLFTGTEVEGQLLVVVSPDATIDKEIEVDRVVNATGTLVPFTAEDLEAAGAAISVDDEVLADFDGVAVLIATEIGDPLAG